MKAADILAPVWRMIAQEAQPAPSCDLREHRLHQLREEFGAVHQSYADYFAEDGLDYDDPEYVATWPLPDYLFSEKTDMIEAARRFIIARDFSEFDRKRALMLWKLQHNQ